ncbi:helix-turn-helix domain-containing protein [Leptolyngbya sp. 15MV]|nr:helix-turn-helix domain-containing protein [Leptolyngbya sp. 15MV]
MDLASEQAMHRSVHAPTGALPSSSVPLNLEAVAEAVAARVLAQLRASGPVQREYLSTSEAAIYCGLSKDWFNKNRAESADPVPFVKVSDARGGAVRYRRADLDAFMLARREGGGA